MLILQDISYLHPNKDVVFNSLNLKVQPQEKMALIGANGIGKSTLLNLLARKLQPSAGLVKVDSNPYLVPQVFGQFNDYTVAQALQIADKLQAITEILAGNATLENMELLADDWTIEERCKEALIHWKLENITLTQAMESLSGGQKTRVFLAGIMIHLPKVVLLDEPTNHLDNWARNQLYNYIEHTKNTLVVVSHDRTLLNLLPEVAELHPQGITRYGGNYDFYVAQKAIEQGALAEALKHQEKTLRKAKEIERQTIIRQQKLDARGQKKQHKAGMPTIVMNTLKNNAERSTAKIKGVHTEKINQLSQTLTQLRSNLLDKAQMKLNLAPSSLYKGKLLVEAKAINFGYGGLMLWERPLNFRLSSGQRVAIKGQNGSGKTTLVKMILGQLTPKVGTLERGSLIMLYLDQDYSLINNDLSIYEQAQAYNTGVLQEHEIKTRLNRFLFNQNEWDKPCSALSGGEKMRLMLCALTIGHQSPDLMILDEPTNNLDIQNIAILTAALNEYEGTLLVISHDCCFLEEIKVEDCITVD